MTEFFNKLREWSNMECPLPRYYWCHIAIALLIAAGVWPFLGLVAGLTAGATFYIGREFTQWESGLKLDWKGLVAPVAACLLVLTIYWWLT